MTHSKRSREMPASRWRHRLIALAWALPWAVACNSSDAASPPSDLPARTFRMGFSAFPPRASEDALLAALDMWTRRADAAIMHVSVPYKALLTGTSATTYVNSVDLPLANYFRAKNLPLTITLDVTDGLDRSAEAPELVELGRSIAEPAVQARYREYVQAVVTIIRPANLGLAAETNLIRDVAPAPLYAALVQMTNSAASDVAALSGKLPALYVSVQADDAWGKLINNGVYQGIERDFADFPFMDVLGVSSYPYFVYPNPEDVPLNYYSRLRNGRTIPLLVVEGGWTSEPVGPGQQSSQEKQARYWRRHEQILDEAGAIALFQLNFTDIDVASLNLPAGSTINAFSRLGLVNADLVPKAALATYDSIFARPVKR